jgi:hypothetical protein
MSKGTDPAKITNDECVDLINTHTLKGKDRSQIDVMCLTILMQLLAVLTVEFTVLDHHISTPAASTTRTRGKHINKHY